MDVKHLENIEIPKPKHYFITVWGLQKGLVRDYAKIEKLPAYPLNLDLKDSQTLLKDFISRAVEELAEAYEQITVHKDFQLFYEELADTLHFMVETMIFSGHLPDFVGPKMLDIIAENAVEKPGTAKSKDINFTALAIWMWDVTYLLNLARNVFRNKPWKQTQVITKQPEYILLLRKAFSTFIYGMTNVVGLSKEEIFAEYYKKNQINRFRIKSKY